MGKKSLPNKVELQHDFDRLAPKKLVYVYQLLILENSSSPEERVSNKKLVLK
jgi:hypothetical protein